MKMKNNKGWEQTILSFLRNYTVDVKQDLPSIISDLFLLEKDKDVHIQIQPKSDIEIEIAVSYSDKIENVAFRFLSEIEEKINKYIYQNE